LDDALSILVGEGDGLRPRLPRQRVEVEAAMPLGWRGLLVGDRPRLERSALAILLGNEPALWREAGLVVAHLPPAEAAVLLPRIPPVPRRGRARIDPVGAEGVPPRAGHRPRR